MRLDVFGMCNALFDIQATVTDEQLAKIGKAKGSMTLVSADEQRAILDQVRANIVNTEPGGSGANTMLGVALLGGASCFTSHVGRDEFGAAYRDGLAAKGVKPNLGVGDGSTGVCLVLITPDAQRTMCTCLGTAQSLVPDDVNADDLAHSRYLYVTGYLWDTDTQKEAVLRAMHEARRAGVKVSLSLSDTFCIARHKDDFRRLVHDYVDLLFANADEAMALTDTDSAEEAVHSLRGEVDMLAVTLDRRGSLVRAGGQESVVPPVEVTAVDTTGAGDMYAAGVLYGLSRGWPIERAGRLASWAAAQVVAKMGPRLDTVDRETVERIGDG